MVASRPNSSTAAGNRVELREGIWNGKGHDENLKLINVPVLKHHDGSGITGAVKSYYGILSMADGWRSERHYERLGAHCGEMIAANSYPGSVSTPAWSG